jgi:cyclic pyranopterin phosphate synthase
MPPEGVAFKPHADILRYEEMAFFVDAATEVGISKIRLTGGEPLVRKGLPDLVRLLKAMPGVTDVSLTTNGVLLPVFADALASAGLDRVNISLDTLDPERYRELTRGGSLAQALAGVDAALAHGFSPVKLNAVLLPETLSELDAFVALVRDRPLHLRFIEWMPVGGCGPRTPGESLRRDDVVAALAHHGGVERAGSPGGWGPAEYFRVPGHTGTIGFISSMSDHFCGECNRLRLTADGRLKSCLFSSEEIDVRGAVRAGDREATLAAIRASLEGKTFDRRVLPGVTERGMSQIGG